jgi:hypothetical protein
MLARMLMELPSPPIPLTSAALILNAAAPLRAERKGQTNKNWWMMMINIINTGELFYQVVFVNMLRIALWLHTCGSGVSECEQLRRGAALAAGSHGGRDACPVGAAGLRGLGADGGHQRGGGREHRAHRSFCRRRRPSLPAGSARTLTPCPRPPRRAARRTRPRGPAPSAAAARPSSSAGSR